MKRLSKGVVIAVTLVIIITLAACSSGISQEDYGVALAERDSAKTQLAEAESQLSSAMDDNGRLQTQRESLQVESDIRLAELTLSVAELAVSSAKAGSLEGQLQVFQVEKTSLQSQLSSALEAQDTLVSQVAAVQGDISNLQAQLSSAQAQVVQLNTIFPPRQFRDGDELRAWLVEDDISAREDTAFVEEWFAYALVLQQRASAAGYVIAADFVALDDQGSFFVWNSAVTDDNEYYIWNPESDGIVYILDIRTFLP